MTNDLRGCKCKGVPDPWGEKEARQSGDEDEDQENDDGDGDDNDDDDDIYIMMKCLCVCVSRKIITSSWESPVTT